jgi:hypothetical protein
MDLCVAGGPERPNLHGESILMAGVGNGGGKKGRMGVVDVVRRGRAAGWVALGMGVLFASAGSFSLAGPEFKKMSIPLPIVIEGKPIPSKMYLKVEMKSYNEPFDEFAAGPRDKAEAMFVKAVQAVRKNDAAVFGSVWTPPDQMKSIGGQPRVVKMADNGPDGWMKVIRSMFDFSKLTVVAEVLAGQDTMFIWDSETKNGIVRRSMYVGLDRSGNLRLSAPGGNNPVDDLLQNAFVAAQAAPDSYKALPGINLRYQFLLPLAGKLDGGPHPVLFEFDGSTFDFPLNDEKVKAPTPLLDFLRTAHSALKSGMYEAYASFFTPNSQEKVKELGAAEEKRRQEEKLQREKKPEPEKSKPVPVSATQSAATPASKPKAAVPLPPPVSHVKFVLNADPIYLVFQAPGKGDVWTPDTLTYSYVLHQGGGDYKITNFEYQNTLDEFLQHSGLFDMNLLKPAPAKAGAANATSVPVPAKAATVNKN